VFPALMQALLVRVAWLLRGGSLALIDIFSKVDEEQDISSQSVPPASFIYDAMMHGNEWSLYHRSNELYGIQRSMIDQSQVFLVGCVMAPA